MTLEEYLNYFTKENLENTKYGAIEYGFLKELEALRVEYEELKVSFDEISKAFEATEHCCPYDHEKCSKTNCFVVGGGCARRSKKAREEE